MGLNKKKNVPQRRSHRGFATGREQTHALLKFLFDERPFSTGEPTSARRNYQ